MNPFAPPKSTAKPCGYGSLEGSRHIKEPAGCRLEHFNVDPINR
jgi:hypothetical protein